MTPNIQGQYFLLSQEGEIAVDETRGVAADVGNLAGLDYPKQKWCVEGYPLSKTPYVSI
jgi:hypothetical protein